MKKTGLLVWLFFSVIFSFAQNQVRPQPYGAWLMYFGNNKLSEKWGIHSEAQFRNYFVPKNVEQLLLRAGVNYYLSPSHILTSGYGYIFTQPASEGIIGATTLEHRIWEQLVLLNRTQKLLIEHRYRLEQRFIENLDRKTKTFDNRIRYRFFASFPLFGIGQEQGNIFFCAYNEVFINLPREVPAEVFDRNRLYFALGYQPNKQMNIQLGYLHQAIGIPTTNTLDINHNLQLALVFNPELRRKN